MQHKTIKQLWAVVAIIGILATVSVIALLASRARARDAKRLADVKQLQSALALYQHDAESYPATASVTAGAILSYNGTVFMAVVPTPPLPDDGCTGSTAYTYAMQVISGDQTSYTLKYCLGSDTAGVSSGLNIATPAGIKTN